MQGRLDDRQQNQVSLMRPRPRTNTIQQTAFPADNKKPYGFKTLFSDADSKRSTRPEGAKLLLPEWQSTNCLASRWKPFLSTSFFYPADCDAGSRSRDDLGSTFVYRLWSSFHVKGTDLHSGAMEGEPRGN